MLTTHMGYSSTAKFIDNGLIQSEKQKTHWFQATVQLADAMFLKGDKQWNYHHDRFFIRSLSLKNIHPIDYLYEKHIKIINGQPLTDKDDYLSSILGEDTSSTTTNDKKEGKKELTREEKKLLRKERKEKRLAKKAALQNT